MQSLKETNRSLEYQYRQISKTGRQSALTAALSSAESTTTKTPVKTQPAAMGHAPLIATPKTSERKMPKV